MNKIEKQIQMVAENQNNIEQLISTLNLVNTTKEQIEAKIESDGIVKKEEAIIKEAIARIENIKEKQNFLKLLEYERELLDLKDNMESRLSEHYSEKVEVKKEIEGKIIVSHEFRECNDSKIAISKKTSYHYEEDKLMKNENFIKTKTTLDKTKVKNFYKNSKAEDQNFSIDGYIEKEERIAKIILPKIKENNE